MHNNFTEGAILPKLLKFMLPVLFAMFLQSLYGAVDLLVVGQFAADADVSAVSTGSQIVMTLTNLIVSFSMGITVAVGQRIGQKRPEEAAHTIGTGLILFAATGAAFTLISMLGAGALAFIMQAPAEAFDLTKSYIRICGAGFLITFCRGDLLAGIFSNKPDTVADAWDYLKAYAIDCLLTCFLFCFIGFYNGLGKTRFVMIQGMIGAFLVRIPVAFLMQHIGHGSLFLIGLATPCSTVLQITMCFAAFLVFVKKERVQSSITDQTVP